MPSKKEIETVIKGAWGLPPQKAIDFLESKGLKVSVDWTDVWKEAHARAFTVAGITRLDLLKDVHESLVDAQKRGVPFEEFKKGFKDILRKKGWLGNQTVTRKDGSEKVVDVSTPRRIKTIFNTNMSSAAMAGMYGELKSMSDEMPYWRYVTVGDGNVRESHARLHGLVLRADDPFWDKYFPPNGFNCRCRVDALTEDEVRENGYKVGDGDTAKYAAMPVVNPGWDYNPGKAVYLPRPEDYPEGMRAEVREFVSKAQEMLREQKLSESEAANGLTDDEKYAISDYVSSGSYFLNEKLRNGTKLTEAEEKRVESLDSALEKFPNYQGTITRSLYFYFEKTLEKFLDEHKVGKPIIYDEFLSTTCGEVYNPKAQVLITIVGSKKGKDIREYNPEEQEILYRRNSRFLVMEKRQVNDVWYITLKEI